MGQRKTQVDRALPTWSEATEVVATFERDDAPQVPLSAATKRPPAARRRRVADDEAELAEFRQFFIATRPDLVALQPQEARAPHPPQKARKSPRPRKPSRLAAATSYIGRLAIIRPEVRVPWLRLPGRQAKTELALDVARDNAPRRLKLPPVWLLANFVVLAAFLVAFLPQLVSGVAQAGCSWYTTQPGDTLGRVSQRYGVSVHDITVANHISDPNLITVDERLCIPVSTAASALEAFVGVTAHPPAPVAPARIQAFINFTLPYARTASKETGWPVSMILAQWGLETSWRVKTFTGYNWGNCGAMPNEPTTPGTSAPGSPAAFAYAYTPDQGVEEYVHVAHLRYYAGVATAWRTSGADAAARALGASPWDWGHYTNRNSPGSSIVALMKNYNLYWYDKN